MLEFWLNEVLKDYTVKIKKLKSDDKELINQHKAALATLAKKDDAEKEFTKAKCIGDKVIKSLKDEIQKFKEEALKMKEEKHISKNNLYLEKQDKIILETT